MHLDVGPQYDRHHFRLQRTHIEINLAVVHGDIGGIDAQPVGDNLSHILAAERIGVAAFLTIRHLAQVDGDKTIRLADHLVPQDMKSVDVERHLHRLFVRRDPLVGRSLGELKPKRALGRVVFRQFDEKPRRGRDDQKHKESEGGMLVGAFHLLLDVIQLVSHDVCLR